MHLGVCSFFERPVDGAAFAMGSLPLHVTVLGNFRLQGDYKAFASIVKTAARILPIEVRLGADERFGRHGEYQVTEVHPSDGLNGLHGELLTYSRRIGAEMDDPDFADSGFRAHVTWLGGVKPTFARELSLQTLSIVDLEPDGDDHLRRVVDTF